MRNFVLALLLAVAPLTVLGASTAIDFIDPTSATEMSCLKGQGINVAPRIFHDGGGGLCDATGGQNIKNAVAAGVGVMPYIFPNPQTILHGGNNATVQVYMGVYCGAAAGASANNHVYFLDIELDSNNPWPDCQTSSDYILEMIAALWQFSDIAGVYTSVYEWKTVTCQSTADDDVTNSFNARLAALAKSMPAVGVTGDLADMAKHATPVAAAKSMLLWYAHYDNQPNFNDFVPFGPFKGAFMKQYADNANVCGIPCDKSWSPL